MSDTDKLTEQKISSEEVFNGALLHVFRDRVRLPDGETSVREWINHPGASAVLPVYANGEVLLIKQFRYPLQQVFFEVPAGKIDSKEAPEATAARELREEAGLDFKQSQYLGPFYPSIGYTNEVIHLYVAWELEEHDQKTDDDEFLIPQCLPFKKAVEMVHSGIITDGKTMVTLLRAWHWWKQQGPFGIA